MNANLTKQAAGLQVFYNENENVSVRTKIINGEPWFVGKDFCNLLGLVNHKKSLQALDDDERRGVTISDPIGEISKLPASTNPDSITSSSSAASRKQKPSVAG